MTLIGWVQIALVLSLVFLCAVPLGRYIAAVVGTDPERVAS